MEHIAHTCKSCGNVFQGNFCNLCGEKILHASDRSFKRFAETIFKSITFADSKFIKTLWLVLKKPGFLTKQFVEGKRVKYLKPLSLFLVLNLAYFFFPVIQLFNASLNTQLRSSSVLLYLRHLYSNVVATKASTMGVDLAAFSLIYNLKTVGLAKLMVMIFVVIASLPLNLLYFKRNRFFTDHIDYMVELACFNLLVNAIVLSIVTAFTGLGNYLNETSLTIIFIATNLYFLIRASVQFYDEKGWRLILKSIVMMLFLKVALELYRSILFFVTIWSL
ncbi:MAG: DUF3667 domain-containing protein [Bacteroidetes bacterium]|nr:DUF3667 domain-containing protein [Bacteroidota bacterium]MBI3482246.1 DUF3667 domain-containing protein [Bacteroidota bacterium]